MAVYTLGLWRTKAGQEESFVSAWREMARATKATFPAASAVLLRDRDDPSLFISFGPWESLDQIEDWRMSAAFTDGVGAIRAHLDGFEPHTMDVAVEID